jgi:hypothetical protein
MTPTARVLKSAARWLQRRSKKRTGADTKDAYKEAIAMLNKLVERRKETTNARSATGRTNHRIRAAADAK